MAAEAAAEADTATDVAEERPRPSRLRRFEDRAYPLVGPLFVFLVTRVTQLVVLAWMTRPDSTVWQRLLTWDSGWFIRVASEGYPSGFTYDANGTLVGNGLAFLPGYPMLVRAFSWTGLSYEAASLVVTVLASFVAAAFVYLLTADIWGRRTGIAMVFLLGAQPMSLVLSMGYSESLFLAFAAGGLYAIRRERWILGGFFAGLACLTRVVGVAVTVALLVALVEYGVRQWRGLRPASLAVWWRGGVGLVLGSLALPLYWWWVDARVGAAGAWFTIQDAGWTSHFDFGRGTLAFVAGTLHDGDGWVAVSTAVLLVVTVGLGVSALFVRPNWWPFLVYGAVILGMGLGTEGYFHSKLRILVPALVVLVPVAVAFGRARLRVAVPVAGVLLGVSGWYGAYMVTVWPYAI
ncbi:hypothetical protein Afil01_47350 [Actinorhabdospora filicis]|uniref:Dolichyl-phosphate-mannose-protein mannosyltransferase n=1 Tax=Actinorhabdospora filicis TaxID=1785913 RepID=A0A9W6WBC2_9ACTN|nr:mannosyltransferase family protein [Actinorhabdospora filicis]GLZ79928.1 hypothetical protein Afil01_47350 [Actinorhabdospora filicis]